MKEQNRGIKKILVVGLITMGLILLAIIGFVLLSKRQPVEKKILSENLTNSKKILDWLDKQRDEKGNYISLRICKLGDEPNCNDVLKSGDSGHDVINAIWARYLYYKKVGDKAGLSIISKDLKNYATNFQIQTDFWNCRMMFQMYQDNALTEEQKRNISTICWRGSYYEIPEYTKMVTVNNTEYDIQIEKPVPGVDLAGIILKNPNIKIESVSTDKISSDLLTMFAAYPSDFVARYKWRHDQHQMDLAKNYFNITTNLYLKDKNRLNNEAVCRLGISSLDIWQETNDKNYLDFAIFLFNEEIMPTAKTPVDFRKYVRPTCGLFANSLYKATGNNLFKEKKDDIVMYLMKDYRDINPSNFLIENDGIFYKGGDNGSVILIKEIRTNGLVAELLTDYYGN